MRVKHLLKYNDSAHYAILFGFITLAISVLPSLGSKFACCLLGVGLLLVWSAARNAYNSKASALIDKHEERFFERMTRERRSAALFLLGENPNGDELEDVLDYFTSPIGTQLKEGSIEAQQVYDIFYHWIRLYYQAGESFISDYRIEEATAYSNLEYLYIETTKCEAKERRGILNAETTEADLILSKKKLTEYLRQEANLKTEASDWEKLFSGQKQ